jgi:copper chaperone CopZ
MADTALSGDRPAAAACPACGPAPMRTEPPPVEPGRLMLSLPGIHCAGCISRVEKGLAAVPGVRDARVNLTLKRASVAADPGVTAEALVTALDALGYEAHELDADMLAATDLDPAGQRPADAAWRRRLCDDERHAAVDGGLVGRGGRNPRACCTGSRR